MLRLSAKWMLAGDGLTKIKDAAILIRDGHVLQLGSDSSVPSPSDAQEIDFGDATILPGLIDAHMHTFGLSSTQLGGLNVEREPYRALRAAAELGEMLQAGFTAARCLGSSVGPDLRRAINEGHILAPQLVAAGEFISSTGGTWDAGPMPSSWSRTKLALADSPEELVRIVRERVRSGSDFIKLGLSKGRPHDINGAWGDDPERQLLAFSDAEVRAAVDEAHRNDLTVSAHAIGDAAVRQCLETGIDIVEHGYAISDDTRMRLVDAKVPIVTTISQLYFHRAAYEAYTYSTADRAIYDRHWEAMKQSFQAGLTAGINFVLGTDLIGKPTHPLKAAAKEFELAVQWGMSPHDALVAGTIKGARLLGISERSGSLIEGKSADLIVVGGDVTKEIGTLNKPLVVCLRGKIIKLD